MFRNYASIGLFDLVLLNVKCVASYNQWYLQGGPKKSGISKTMAITPLKSIRKGKSWCVSENSALMLQDRHQTVQN